MFAKPPSLPPSPAKSASAADRQGVLYVVVAVFCFSLSAVLVRWAAALSAAEIAAARLLIAGIAVLMVAWARKDALPPRRDWPRFALYGLITALHFGLYIAALSFTTIAHTLALVYTAPIFVALFSWLLLGEGLRARQWLGTLVTIGGVALLAGLEPQLDRRMAIGDLMALGSAVCFGLYSVAGRSGRTRYSLFGYAGTVYMFGALWLLPLALVNFTAVGYPERAIGVSYTWRAIGSVLALGLVPLGLGHTLYNAALRRTNATLVNLVATQEVTAGIVLGMILLGEIPSVSTLIGVLVALAGIVLVIL